MNLENMTEEQKQQVYAQYYMAMQQQLAQQAQGGVAQPAQGQGQPGQQQQQMQMQPQQQYQGGGRGRGGYRDQQQDQGNGQGGGYNGRGGRGGGYRGGYQQQDHQGTGHGYGRGGFQRDRPNRSETSKNAFWLMDLQELDDLKMVAQSSFCYITGEQSIKRLSQAFLEGLQQPITVYFQYQGTLIGKCVAASAARARTDVPADAKPLVDALPPHWDHIFRATSVSEFNMDLRTIFEGVLIPPTRTVSLASAISKEGTKLFLNMPFLSHFTLDCAIKLTHPEGAAAESAGPIPADANADLIVTDLLVVRSSSLLVNVINHMKDERHDVFTKDIMRAALTRMSTLAMQERDKALTSPTIWIPALLIVQALRAQPAVATPILVKFLDAELDPKSTDTPVATLLFTHPILYSTVTFSALADLQPAWRPLIPVILRLFPSLKEKIFTGVPGSHVISSVIECFRMNAGGEAKDKPMTVYSKERRKRERDDDESEVPQPKTVNWSELVPDAGDQPLDQRQRVILATFTHTLCDPNLISSMSRDMTGARLLQEEIAPYIMRGFAENPVGIHYHPDHSEYFLRHVLLTDFSTLARAHQANYVVQGATKPFVEYMVANDGEAPERLSKLFDDIVESWSTSFKIVATDKIGSNCFEKWLTYGVPKPPLTTGLSKVGTRILTKLAELFLLDPNSFCFNPFSNFIVQRLFERVVIIPELKERVVEATQSFCTRFNFHTKQAHQAMITTGSAPIPVPPPLPPMVAMVADDFVAPTPPPE